MPTDALIRREAGPEPVFDPVMAAFLRHGADELAARQRPGSLLEAVPLGDSLPWLWRLTFATRGLELGPSDQPRPVDRHTVAVRFRPDYLRRADRFDILRLMTPTRAFHPNLRDGFICLEVWPGQPLVEICESLHALFSWRLRQLAETDALNPAACEWGRAHLDELPLDDRPLFGRALRIQLDPLGAAP